MQSDQGKTYLRVGGDVFPVYGDELRGWSPRAADFGTHQAPPRFVYTSLDELYFVLVNLCTARAAPSFQGCRGGFADRGTASA